ncbi:PAS domain-containing protein [Chondromyces crocatus]|uniref:Anti-anti-sigma factor n=1 Tax=Chondromyces crocatus TaxID=52 RepID=A0A0K1ESB9_CHOCO|nr:PAS domain-containing protein [Chondromyces crocatus]AKT43513.1 uncharacterized protein CMC5_077450 [Chondromyces crocatus]
MSKADPTQASLEAENAVLRQRIAELEAALIQSDRTLQTIIDQVPGLVYAREHESRRIIFINHAGASYLGLDTADVIGRPDSDFFPPEIIAKWHETDAQVVATGQVSHIEESAPYEDGLHTHRTIKFPLVDREGHVLAVGGISIDITEQRRAEERALMAHRDALRELSTPIIPLTDDALVIPVVGALDAVRAQQLLEQLLEGVSSRKARLVILDVTATGDFDATVVELLLQGARAVRLLGARVILTGISPAMAQSMLSLGVDLEGVVTLGSLLDGVKYALRQR